MTTPPANSDDGIVKRAVITHDHPEALGRVPQKGDVEYPLTFNLNDGSQLIVRMGEPGFQNLSNIVTLMKDNTPPANSEAVQAAMYYHQMCDRLWEYIKSCGLYQDGTYGFPCDHILIESHKRLQAALAEKEQQVEFLQHTVLVLGKEKVAANKRIEELEAITPDEALKVLLESSEQLRREAEQERDRYRTALKDIYNSIPACGQDGSLYFAHFDEVGNETGVQYVDPLAVIQSIEGAAQAALATNLI